MVRHLVRRRQHLGVLGQPAVARDDHAHRVPALGEPHRELGIVTAHGAGAHEHGVHRRAQLVHGPAAVQAADPARVAPGRRDLAVKGDGGLVRHQRQAAGVELQEGRVLRAGARPPRLFGQQRRPRRRRAARSSPRPLTSGLGSRRAITARATPAATSASAQGGVRPVVAARLQRAVQRRARAPARPPSASATASACGSPRPRCEPVPTTSPSLHQHGADERVGMRAAAARLGQFERLLHVPSSSSNDKKPRSQCFRADDTRHRARCFSHPDCDRRPRNLTWSASEEARGL